MNDNRIEALQVIYEELLALRTSPLYEYRVENDYFPVAGQGSAQAKIMFIGEAPGAKEAQTGKPFCGASGRILDELLASIELDRESVYITNIVKDRPPNNRDPHKAEIALYAPFLVRQIDIIQPQVIATLGRFSMQFVLDLFGAKESGQKISALHGKHITVQTSYGTSLCIPLYHPAVALYKASQKETLLADFATIRTVLT